MTIQIEKNIPLPGAAGGSSLYPFRDLEVGDSFYAPRTDGREKHAMRTTLVNIAARLKPRKFSIRSVDDGFRVWRIA